MTVQISASQVYAAWRAFTDALNRYGADSPFVKHEREKYQRLARMHDEIADAIHEAREA